MPRRFAGTGQARPAQLHAGTSAEDAVHLLNLRSRRGSHHPVLAD